MDGNQKYVRFKIGFHTLILIVAIGFILASIAGWNEMDRALLYFLLGVVFAVESVVGLYQNYQHKLVQ